MPFPSVVNVVPAPAVVGDFASTNPRFVVQAGPGALVAGANGVAVGLFAWAASSGLINPSSGEVDFYDTVNNFGAGAPTGFVHREQQALITSFLADNTLVVPAGLPVTLFAGGDFWVRNAGSTATQPGQKAYANNTTGAITFAATGTPPTAASVTGTVVINSFTGSIAVNSVTGSISGTTLTVSAIAAGTVLGAGQFLSGGSSSVGYVDAATYIVGQLTGTAGGVGTYQVSVNQTVTSTTIAATGGGLTISAVTTGVLAVGQTITTGAAAGTTIVALGTGTGGTGTYTVSVAQTVASTTIVTSGALLNVTAVGSGALAVGQTISGGTITAGTYITAFVTGLGGTGTYLTSTSVASSSGTVVVYSGTETKWYAMSAGAAGELVKITSHPLG